jgi:hypothetical protein
LKNPQSKSSKRTICLKLDRSYSRVTDLGEMWNTVGKVVYGWKQAMGRSLRGQKGSDYASGSWDGHISQGETPNERHLIHRDAPGSGRHEFATMAKLELPRRKNYTPTTLVNTPTCSKICRETPQVRRAIIETNYSRHQAPNMDSNRHPHPPSHFKPQTPNPNHSTRPSFPRELTSTESRERF